MNKALIIVDLQNDFIEGGSLAVPNSLEIIPKINQIKQNYEHVILTQDYHPQNHISFHNNHPGNLNPFTTIQIDGHPQELWPPHCVQNTKGSEFHKDLQVNGKEYIFRKGTNSNIDSYSGFGNDLEKTGLRDKLIELKIEEVYICGLALDFCVLNTAIDAFKFGFKTHILMQYTKAICLPKVEGLIKEGLQSAIKENNTLNQQNFKLID